MKWDNSRRLAATAAVVFAAALPASLAVAAEISRDEYIAGGADLQ